MVALPKVQEETPLPADWDEGVEKREQHYAAHLAELEGIEGRVTYAGPREELVQFSKDLDLLIVGSRN